MKKGQQALYDIITLLEKSKELPAYKFQEDLCLEIPDNPEHWTSKEVLKDILLNKKSQVGDKYKKFGFHFDIGINDAFLSSMFQLVDEEYDKERRNNILSEEFQYIGISFTKIDKKFCVYILFAN